MPALPEQAIISSATAAAVDSAFNALAHTVLVQNAKTLEDLVKEMLRPMLQHWLDNNLPTLVERLVRQEIERVARGRRASRAAPRAITWKWAAGLAQPQDCTSSLL